MRFRHQKQAVVSLLKEQFKTELATHMIASWLALLVTLSAFPKNVKQTFESSLQKWKLTSRKGDDVVCWLPKVN